MSKQKKALLNSALSLLLCFSMLLGTTFAWFTDSVTSTNNIIKSGNLDVTMHWCDTNSADENDWKDASTGAIFDYQYWEPGFTQTKYVKIANEGSLAFHFVLNIVPNVMPETGNPNLADVIDVYMFDVNATVDRAAIDTATPVGTLADLMTNSDGAAHGVLLPAEGKGSTVVSEIDAPKGEISYCIVLKMQEDAGNEYQDLSVGEGFSVQLLATQYTYEEDSFGSDYDEDSEWPGLGLESPASGNVTVTTTDGKVDAEATISTNTEISATVPAGVAVNDGTTQLTLTVSEKATTDSGLTTGTNEELMALDVHIDGVSEGNTTPIIIALGKVLPVGMNMGNVALYHVENGVTNVMTQVQTLSELDAHNEFYYDPATGEVTVAMATFSEVTFVANTTQPWQGNIDVSWYNTTDTSFVIANADQLAGFGQIVGGMVKNSDGEYYQDSFKNKTVTLISDINLADDEDNNDATKIFYPIGYYSSDHTYTKPTGEAITTGFYTFEGTFDGNGHTITNFYQNTWEMKGDHNWYNTATEQHYRDGMGLFGKVYGGTVKNLTVANFSSDGEIATTGTIAAYADCGATFENIAIFNCNPRVYNIGNGGIVGVVGWYANEEHTTPVTFRNITVDNSNKISALWGSWDVPCGGLVGSYYPTSGQENAIDNAGIYMENCHVAAQIDVNNDVCANYQYYAYRYAGMLIGSVRENVKGDDGNVYPKMDGITASDCTVHFGDWNDYYYCELVANSLAAYTHDHQFSRLTQVDSVDVENKTVTIDGETTAIPASGRNNYVVVSGEHATENATCYHFVDGEVWSHSDAGTETVDGVEGVLKEDKQHIYLEFNNLVTGYGWGVTTKAVGDLNGVTILDREEGNSYVKFESVAEESYMNQKTVTVGELFEAANIDDKKLSILSAAVNVTVSPADASSTAGGAYAANTTDWTQGTLTFSGTGAATITITDYYFCTPTTINVTITERVAEVKFENKFTGDFLYRVGNASGSTVKLGTLFSGTNVTNGNIEVTFTNVAGDASGSYTANTTDWPNGTIQFTGTGVVKVIITDNDYCTPTELTLEVVDAVNVTTATNATDNNVVLLNDCGFSSLEVSGGYALYGNGFTMTCSTDSYAKDFGYAFVSLEDGTLDNVQIVCPNFDYAALYKSNLTSSDNRSYTDSFGTTRYYNAKSGVMVSGNSQILNSRISGARAAVNVSGGNCVIDNSRIELGAVASVLVGAANSVTLRDVTLVQKPTASTYDSSKTLMGFSVLVMCTSGGDAAPITLEGTLVQNAWVDENDKQYVPEDAQTIIDTVMGEEEYLHDIDGNGTNESLNLGIAYMPADGEYTVNTPSITDNRTNKDTIPYDSVEVKYSLVTTYVYSYKNTNGTDDSIKTEATYTPNKYSDIITVTYSDTTDGLTTGKSYGTDGWVYELNVDLDTSSGYELDFSKLSMSVNGVAVTDYKVNGSDKPTSPVAVTAGGTTYTLTATVNETEYTATLKVTGTETSKESPSLVASNYEAGLCVASSYGGTWHGAAPVLEEVQIKYWSVAEQQYKTIKLSDYTPTTAGQQNGTNSYWTYTPDNGDFTLTIKNETAVHSGNSVYAMPVVCDSKLYFVASSSNGLVNSGNSARTIAITYYFNDNNNGEQLKFSNTWSVEENKDDQYKYSDFCSGTKTKLENCVTPDTLITLADGSQVRVDSLVGDEMLLVWNIETGMLDSASILFVDSESEAEYEIIHLYFSDGTDVKVIGEHGFWDYDLNKYVYLDRYAEQYIGHAFAKQNVDALEKVQLTDVVIETEVTTAWSPVTEGHLCYFVNGMLSMPGGVGGLFNIFDVDAETMTYDYEAMAEDIATYGLFTYEELNAIEPLSEDMFNAAGGAYLKISIGKGNLTMDELTAMIRRYSKFFD